MFLTRRASNVQNIRLDTYLHGLFQAIFIRIRKIALRDEQCCLLMRQVAEPRQFWPVSQTTRPRGVLQRINRSQAASSGIRTETSSVSGRPSHVFQHAHPSARNDAVVPCSHRAARRTTGSTSHSRLGPPNCSLPPPRAKSSPAPPGTTRAQSPRSYGTRTRARGPPSCVDGRPPCRCSTSGPLCPQRRLAATPTASRTFYLRCIARRRLLFYFLAELVVTALFPVLHLAFGPTVARAAAAAFLAQG